MRVYSRVPVNGEEADDIACACIGHVGPRLRRAHGHACQSLSHASSLAFSQQLTLLVQRLQLRPRRNAYVSHPLWTLNNRALMRPTGRYRRRAPRARVQVHAVGQGNRMEVGRNRLTLSAGLRLYEARVPGGYGSGLNG